jgi:hypothetical protein
MKMELFYVAELKEKPILESVEAFKEKVAEYIAGPFGTWEKATEAKHEVEKKRIGHPNLEVMVHTIEVE